MLRFVFLRFLPRRLFPVLMLFEIIWFVRRRHAHDTSTTSVTTVKRRP